MEIWKPVYGLEDRYEASNLGRVKGVVGRGFSNKPQILTPSVNERGYHKIYIVTDEGKLTTFVHRLVALAFIGPPPTEKHTLNHKDGDKLNNVPDNLEWATRKEQSDHFYSVLNGKDKRPRGHGVHHRAVFTDEEILKIRQMRENGYTFEVIRNAFDNRASNVTIQNICKRKIYTHI